MDNQTDQEKSISDQLESVLAQLSTDQIRFVIARQECATDTEAAKAIGIKRDTVYHWPDVVKDAVRLMADDGLITALHIRRRHLAKAMLIKVAGLDSKDERLRQNVATEVIEWELGKATQPTESSGTVDVNVKRAEDLSDDELARIASSGSTGDAEA